MSCKPTIYHLTGDDYEGLHKRYDQWLEGTQIPLMMSKEHEEEVRRQLSDSFRTMMRSLHTQRGTQLQISIMADPKVQQFINTHASVLDSAFRQVPMSDIMHRRLQQSDYIFSGIKTFHELHEAFPSLLDENGNRKPFEQFLNDVRKIDNTYNQNYLRAEYNFAQASAAMAARWEEFMEDGDRYDLQYRTAHDGKVRPEHAALHNVTLPVTDPFWEEFYPPNGWGCRCTVMQVRKGKYPETPHDEAMRLGENATQKDKKGIFRFNSGISRQTFPDYNPYTIRRCRDCDIAKGNVKLAKNFVPDNELCAACKLLHAQKHNTGATERIGKYNKNEWEHTYISPNDNGLVVTQLKRIAEAIASKAEQKKFDKELRMCKVLADNGHDIEYLKGVNRPIGQTYDITMDGIRSDLKRIEGGAGNIVKYTKKALTKQGGDAVIFEMPNPDKKYFEALAEAIRKCSGRIFFYIKDENILKEIK